MTTGTSAATSAAAAGTSKPPVASITTSAGPTWADVLPGAIAGGVAFALIQHFGTRIVGQITENSSDTYGQFALVLGLVTWLGLLAISALMAAEYNAARVRLRRG